MWSYNHPESQTQADWSRGIRSLVVVSTVIGSFDMNPTNSLDSLSLFILIQVMRSSCCTPCSLQQGIVWTPPIVGLVEQYI